jgi:hypothetical protein
MILKYISSFVIEPIYMFKMLKHDVNAYGQYNSIFPLETFSLIESKSLIKNINRKALTHVDFKYLVTE